MRGFLHQALATLVTTGLLVFSSVHSLNAQNGHAVDVGMERDLAHAEALLRSFKNDSANIIIAKLLDLLKAQGHLDSPFGIQVRLAEASALEQDQQSELAILKLLQVKESSKEKNLVDIHSKVCLTLALLYEKIGRGKKSLEHLRETKADIDQYALDSIYPCFAVRMSSWQRIYGNKDSSIYFAKEALRTAPLFRLYLEEAIGHMLMNMLLPKSAVAERLGHSMDGLSLYQKLNDYTGCGFMYGAIASIHFQNNDLLRALVYNDSTISAANKAIAIGCERDPTIASTYKFRGEIYRAMGQQDSAWHYVHKGYRIELDFMEKDNRDKVIEIDSRYNDAQQTQQIKEQNLSLALKNTQLRSSLLVALLILVLAAGVFIAYRKQRQGKRELSEQNALIQRQSEQLKSLDTAKSRFFANVSHELRTPLALLLGPISTLLKENKLTDKQANLLQLARQSGKQLEQLVTDILDLGKLELGKMELDEKPTELAAFFRSYFAQFESLAESREIDFSFDIAVSNDAVANLDQAKCRQILNNLLSNAFKFTPVGGRVEAKLSLDNGAFQMSVTDTGPGIHPDDLPHLFDRYFQTTRPDKPAEGGTGIGLALCQQNVQLFGGKIEVDSALGKGSVFRVAFPVTLSEMYSEMPVLPIETYGETGVLPIAKASGETGVSPDKPTILVVEDNPDLQTYIRLILSEKYNIITAENGQVALDILGQPMSPPSVNIEQNLLRINTTPGPSPKGEGGRDAVPLHPSPLGEGPGVVLILSDLMMPVMDGHQLLEKLKSDDSTRQIPVIMLTARADVRDKLKALRIGVDDYLLKPFDEEELLVRIENLLKNQATRRTVVADEPEMETNAPLLSQPDQEWLETFEAYIQHHLSDDTLSVSTLAYHFAMSESTLLRQLKRLTGLSPIQYLQEMRLDEARRLLENRRYNSIAQVASKVGYNDVRSFSRSFRARFGKSPSEMLVP